MPVPERPEPTTRIRTRASREVYRNPWMAVREDDIERVCADGTSTPGLYAVIEKPRSAVLVPFDGERVHLVGQHRHPVDAWSWELPQGGLGEAADAAAVADARDRGLDAAAARRDADQRVARTELREETGLRAGRLVRLGELAFALGMSAQRFVGWLALDLEAGPPEPEHEEDGMLVRAAVTPDELDAMIDGDELLDAATIATWRLARPHLPAG